MLLRSLLATLLLLPLLPAQQTQTAPQPAPHPAQPLHRARHAVDLRNTYHRYLSVVPMTGTGTHADPRRPAYAPTAPVTLPLSPPASAALPVRTGIIAYSYQLSDDKKLALVEFVAADRAAFGPLDADRTLTVFEKGKHTRAQIETELRKYKKDFDLDTLTTRVP